ncbi:MAG: 6-phosphogluconolactonase [Planctomycetes bacterium]|nr:6-phosphogluconolactonase [Planctomycetota bacterium]
MRQERSPEIFVEPSAEQATGLASKFVKSIIAESVARHGFCYLALAGGTTPHGLYLRLAADGVIGDVPWQNVVVFFGDERDVPQDHAESNYRMAQRTLLDHVPIELNHVHPMPADAEDLDAAAEAYEQTIRRNVPTGDDGIPRFDLILLGMGIDGHTASLFPGTEAVGETRRLVTACFVPVLGRKRMTMTFPLINAAHNVLLFVTGSDKARAVERMLGEDRPDRRELPACGVAPVQGSLKIILDAAAAAASSYRLE